MWLNGALMCVISLLFSFWLPSIFIGFAGYIFFGLFPLLTGVGFYRSNLRKLIIQEGE
jgi:hypothetical protein